MHVIEAADRLVLLVGERGDAWASTHLGRHLLAYIIGVGETDYRSREFTAVYGIEADGAVLMRPDGYVRCRLARVPGDPLLALRSAVDRILAIRASADINPIDQSN
jgi:hypothetical protein